MRGRLDSDQMEIGTRCCGDRDEVRWRSGARSHLVGGDAGGGGARAAHGQRQPGHHLEVHRSQLERHLRDAAEIAARCRRGAGEVRARRRRGEARLRRDCLRTLVEAPPRCCSCAYPGAGRKSEAKMSSDRSRSSRLTWRSREMQRAHGEVRRDERSRGSRWSHLAPVDQLQRRQAPYLPRQWRWWGGWWWWGWWWRRRWSDWGGAGWTPALSLL